jgi:hypothetical protein
LWECSRPSAGPGTAIPTGPIPIELTIGAMDEAGGLRHVRL